MDNIQTLDDFLRRYQYDPNKDLLGGGGFGKVYKAYDAVRHHYVAIKIAEVKKSEKGKKIFSLRDEVMAVSKLPTHPNVAYYEKDELYTFTLSNGVFDYAIMQYYSDGNLSEVLKKSLSVDQKENIARQLLDGIAFLHKHKVVHRDLKPANILVVKHEGKIVPVITDFGLSKEVDDTVFSNSFSGGTRRYSAPEQLQGGQPLKVNVDLWSYGVILYELFTGNPLFASKSGASDSEQAEKEIYDKITKGKVGSLHKMPEKWRKVAERCLIVDSTERAQSADELYEILDAEDKNDDRVGESKGIEKEKIKKYAKIGLAAVVWVAIIIAVCKWLFSGPEVDIDTQRFMACKEVNDYRLYLMDFPDGKHVEEASRFIDAYVADSVAQSQIVFTVNGVSFTMKFVEGGSFMMGSEDEEAGSDERPAHKVEVEDFYLGETEVTQALWKAVMGNNNPSSFKGDSLPVESVSWNTCLQFIRRLNDSLGKSFRLPEEAEWEYAARGGVKKEGLKFSGSDKAYEVAWTRENSDGTHAVKQKRPNGLGLYDMSGNVLEWCCDVYDSYPGGPMDDLEKKKPDVCTRVLRGGSWFYGEKACRVSARSNVNPKEILSSGGLRLALSERKRIIKKEVPEGAIIGLFSVNDSTQVYFSQGNLQYRETTNTWRFAVDQWDVCSTSKGFSTHRSSVSSLADSGWIDVFAWGTSGYNHGAICYQPTASSDKESDYYAYGYADMGLYDFSGKADWGYNAISNGGKQIGLWRTMTADEWFYLLNERQTKSGIRYIRATVCDIDGLLLFPDDWANDTNIISEKYLERSEISTFSAHRFGIDVFSEIQAKGVVFLPSCHYWTSSVSVKYAKKIEAWWADVWGPCYQDFNPEYACYFWFDDYRPGPGFIPYCIGTNSYKRSNKGSVRLVYPIQ